MLQKLESLRKELSALDGQDADAKAYNVILGVMCELLDVLIEREEDNNNEKVKIINPNITTVGV